MLIEFRRISIGNCPSSRRTHIVALDAELTADPAIRVRCMIVRVSGYKSPVEVLTVSIQTWYATGNLGSDERGGQFDLSPGLPHVEVAQERTAAFVRR